ncbi:glycosyltransferase involved in cell wall biosynthesis [Mariniflexile fucanivorans]|uniref:Glycosyltransferase involved in cell wall biosynthesis n=1 Tax=Mariniflexile fucanivorans TaxID=264023 RepID=A0A4R1RDL8_9FLAO|nr:glycosyltransferase [Mariniflexile fucanivorans]TCL63899.1 glycosyltransferase involved in cell wall biosynthesis [Mariniflexile fucanivorans]
MKVLQLIDSLEVGGAERVAVNIANALAAKIEGSYLCVTRVEGLLKGSINESVNFLFLNKKSTFDLKSILKFNAYVKKEEIDIIHAHSSSFFLATIIRILNSNVKIVWHDHYGNSAFLENRKFRVLKVCSSYFNHIFSVNKQLEQWAKVHLKSKNVNYLPNFSVINNELSETNLHGDEGKRIICLANLREQKDHLTLLKAFQLVVENHNDWSLHLVGKDFNDSYSEAIKSFIINNKLEKHVFIYGSKPDTYHILTQSNIGVLSSKSEGLPLALLEYGLAKLPVIATRVGECSEVIRDTDNGLLVSPENFKELSKAIIQYIENKDLRDKYALSYTFHIQNNYSETAQVRAILKVYNNIYN